MQKDYRYHLIHHVAQLAGFKRAVYSSCHMNLCV